MAKRNIIKKQITIYVKRFGFTKYYITWSSQGTLHTVEYLKEHLIYIIQDWIQYGKEISKPTIVVLSKKELPLLGDQTVYARGKVKKDSQY